MITFYIKILNTSLNVQNIFIFYFQHHQKVKMVPQSLDKLKQITKKNPQTQNKSENPRRKQLLKHTLPGKKKNLNSYTLKYEKERNYMTCACLGSRR